MRNCHQGPPEAPDRWDVLRLLCILKRCDQVMCGWYEKTTLLQFFAHIPPVKCRDLSIDIIDIAFHDQNISKTHPNSFRHISTMIPLSPVFKSRSKTPTASHTYSLIRTALSCVSSCFFHLPPAKIQTMIWRNQAVIGCGGHSPRAVFQSWFMNFASPVSS